MPAKNIPVPDQEYVPSYHPTDDSFINDPDSMKFKFDTIEDARNNDAQHFTDCLSENILPSHSKKKTRSMRMQVCNTKNPIRERPIPKKKKKKYPTKPKDHAKISKMKASREHTIECMNQGVPNEPPTPLVVYLEQESGTDGDEEVNY